MSDEELAAAIEENEAECFATFGAIGEPVIIERDTRWIRITTGQAFWLFNGAFRLRLAVGEADDAIDECAAHYAGRRLPFAMFLSLGSQPADLPARLERRGFTADVESTVIVAETADAPPPSLAGDLTSVEIRTPETFAMFSRCFARAHHIPDHLQQFMDRWALGNGFSESSPLQNLAIVRDGEAVAVASYFLHGPIAGLYNVGVLPEHRGRNIGSEIACAAARLARARGARYLGGNSTPDGLRAYRKMRIRPIGTFRRWIRPVPE